MLCNFGSLDIVIVMWGVLVNEVLFLLSCEDLV